MKDFTSMKWTADAPLTPSKLLKMRDAFWDTQPSYSGRMEIWQALRLVCESQSTELAQAIIDSASITVPTGALSDGCYDELGNQYVIPLYCFVEPTNMVVSRGADEFEAIRSATSFPEATISDKQDSTADKEGSIIQKTQSVVDKNPAFHLTIRLSSGRDMRLGFRESATVLDIKRAVLADPQFTSDPANAKAALKVLYLGKILDDKKRIRGDSNIDEKSIVQILVIQS